jgi:hypothetical protein
MTSLVFIVANDIAEIASSAYKSEGQRWAAVLLICRKFPPDAALRKRISGSGPITTWGIEDLAER